MPTGELGAQTNTAIYLDTNAAGYGWFVDTTPKSNREFKKTSSASELKAKDNSAAFGKMDLLTVVMHELGHRMGFGHTSDPTNLMAEDLDVGTRRVPLTERAEARAASSARTAIRIASSNGSQSSQGDSGTVAVDSTPDTGTADIITPTVTSESKGRSKSRLFGRIGKQAKLAADATDLDQLFSGDFGGLLETDER